ncbi:MAG: FAD-binding protein [Defluviitaleaceae bacterium]|nr:FAD-binding protein [Defluviitaleaceae bacterium]
MYSNEIFELIKKVEATRQERVAALPDRPVRMTADEKTELLRKFHPDHIDSEFDLLKIGPNAGEKVPKELARLLQGKSMLLNSKYTKIDLTKTDFETDILIIGGGGAGCAAGIIASEYGAKVTIATKLRIGDANTMMAEGGIQAAVKENDSPATHYLDAFGGGHFAAQADLLKKLVSDGPGAIKWLDELGVMFDKDADGVMITTHGGGTSRKRMHAAADYTGKEIMRTLRDEVQNRGIEVMDYTAAIELLLDEDGKACGAILQNMETGDNLTARAKVVILATGGAGRLHYQGFPTSNHYGATADGLVLAYRAGVPLLYADTFQYHPTGVAYPQQLFGALVTEKVRALGAMLVNIDGEAFVHPLETRDVAAAAVIRECKERRKGIDIGEGSGIWLDSPIIETIKGEGTIERSIPAMMKMFLNYGIDMRKVPVLIYPTLHYQNGGVSISENGETAVPNLLAAGEVVGGIHGRNRLMGNSLLDVIVFGRNAGHTAGAKFVNIKPGNLSLAHVTKFESERAAAGITEATPSPMLLPDYTR